MLAYRFGRCYLTRMITLCISDLTVFNLIVPAQSNVSSQYRYTIINLRFNNLFERLVSYLVAFDSIEASIILRFL